MIDPATLTEPALDGETWTYPPSWASADRTAWEALVGEQLHHARAVERMEADRAAAAKAPAALLAAKRAQVTEVKRLVSFAERRAAGESAWATATADLGDRAARIDGEEGDVLILDGSKFTDKAVEAATRRGARLAAAAVKSGKTQGEAMLDSNKAHDDMLEDAFVHPARPRVKELFGRYAGLRTHAYEIRDALIRGWRDAEGKGTAP
jgi:hypothetical protein